MYTVDSQFLMMRAPCLCGCEAGYITTVSGQDTVRCGICHRGLYNAPRSETGREQRTVRTRPGISASQRARILLRDNQTCIVCHRADVPLDVGHLISVKEGREHGLADTDLFDDENLAAMCQSCNAGLSSDTVTTRLMLAVLKIRVAKT